MTNLGYVEQNDGIRLHTELTNISDVLGDAVDIRVSIVDDDDNILINESNTTHVGTGLYEQDIFLDSNKFNTGLFHVVWSGYTTNISFYHSDYFSIEENRLV